MIVFFLLGLVLVGVSLWFLLRPLLRDNNATSGPDSTAVLAMFREKLAELEAEKNSGAITPEVYDQSKRETERQLLEAVTAPPVTPKGPRRALGMALAVAALLLVVPVGMYLWKGSPDALLPGGIAESGAQASAGNAEGAQAGNTKAKPLTSGQVEKMIQTLADNLKKNPGDAPGWTMLARAYAYEHQYPDAVKAFTRAIALNPRDARLLSDTADAMAMSAGQKLDGEPMKLIERALQIDPTEIKALALAGTYAFEHKDYAQAVQYWDRAVKAAPNDPEFAQGLKASLEEARQLAGGKAGAVPPMLAAASPQDTSPGVASAATKPVANPAAAVHGRVTLSASLTGKARPGDTVFVFAKAVNGPKMPLALMRRQVKDLPFEFSLDDSMAMMPELTLSKYAPVVISARVSRSGDAIAASGDLQGSSKPVPAGAKGISIVIDQVVP